MSTVFMKEAEPKLNLEMSAQRRKELKEAYKKGAKSGAASPEVVATKKTPESGGDDEKETLMRMILEAPTTEEAKEIFDELGKGALSREEFVGVLKKRQEERKTAVVAITAAPTETKGLPKGKAEPELYKTDAAEIEEGPEVLKTGAGPTPEPEENTVEQTETRPQFETLETLEEAFGRGDVKLEEFLKEKARFTDTAPMGKTIPSEGEVVQPSEDKGLYEFLKDYVAQREIQQRADLEEQKLQQRKRRRPKRHPIRGRVEETERIRQSSAPEFPPTKEMQEIAAEIKTLVDQAQAKWERLIAYKQLNARTLKMVGELAECFRKLGLLRNKLQTERIKARALFEKKAASEKEAIHGPATKVVERSPGFEKGATIGEAVKFKEMQRKAEEQRKRAFKELKKRQKEVKSVSAAPFTEALADYMDKVEEKFGRGDIEPDEFSAKRDLVKRFRTSPDVLEELNTAFGEDTLDLDEYKELKSKLTKKTPRH